MMLLKNLLCIKFKDGMTLCCFFTFLHLKPFYYEFVGMLPLELVGVLTFFDVEFFHAILC